VKKLLLVVVAVALLASQGIAGPLVHRSARGEAGSERGSIQGVWRAVEVTMTGPAARTISQIQPNLTIITARHYSRINIDTEEPRPILADVTKASPDELRAVWGPFVGEAGTYEVTSNIITMRPIAAKNPAVMGAGVFITYSFKLDGNTMWVTQERNQNGPFAHPVTVKVVRIE
jgi:hypothetical protein